MVVGVSPTIFLKPQKKGNDIILPSFLEGLLINHEIFGSLKNPINHSGQFMIKHPYPWMVRPCWLGTLTIHHRASGWPLGGTHQRKNQQQQQNPLADIPLYVPSWWLNQPIWKNMLVKLDIFTNFRDENKNYLKPPPRYWLGFLGDPYIGLSNLKFSMTRGQPTHQIWNTRFVWDLPMTNQWTGFAIHGV